MSALWDSSALVKLYADEQDAEVTRSWTGPIAVSALSLTEVMAAFWGKVDRGELREHHARVLDRAFMADVRDGRFVVLAVTERIIATSLGCARDHRLRGADAVQLASALIAREIDRAVDTMAVFDRRLRDAAAVSGFALLPPG